MKELRIRKATLKKNRIVPCQILSCLCQHFQLRLYIGANSTKEDEFVTRDWIDNFRPLDNK